MRDKKQLFIDGQWVDATSGATFEAINPATGEVIAHVAAGSSRDVDKAVIAAHRAFHGTAWGMASSPRDRARILFDAAAQIRAERESLAALETADCGKPYSDALDDVDEAAFMFEYYAGWATKTAGSIPPLGPDAMSLVVKEPIGVAALITPWNFPIAIASTKVAPALASGCTAILKPAESTSLTALELARILAECGLPDGVFNVITGFGPEVGAPLVRHPDVDKISFTGSVPVGKQIQRTAAETLKRVTLELGGKSPNLVFADADLDEAVPGTAFGIFWNQGEVCTAGSRVLVDAAIHDEVVSGLIRQAEKLRLGDGMDPSTSMGPLVSGEHLRKVESYLERAENEGASIAYAGTLPTDDALRNGYFCQPTIFTGVDNSMTIAQEEIFGPVMSVIPFGDEDEAIAIANDTRFGLAAAVWTKDIKRALRTSRALKAGVVWVNDSQPAPTEAAFGGYRESGIGRELGEQGIDAYLETKQIYINLA